MDTPASKGLAIGALVVALLGVAVGAFGLKEANDAKSAASQDKNVTAAQKQYVESQLQAARKVLIANMAKENKRILGDEKAISSARNYSSKEGKKLAQQISKLSLLVSRDYQAQKVTNENFNRRISAIEKQIKQLEKAINNLGG